MKRIAFLFVAVVTVTRRYCMDHALIVGTGQYRHDCRKCNS
jgi:hypothetical protein